MHYQEKYGHPPADVLSLRPRTNEERISQQDDELEDLFESVVEEIEERQEYLENILKIGGKTKDVEERLKNEIVERIGELQRIREIQKKL